MQSLAGILKAESKLKGVILSSCFWVPFSKDAFKMEASQSLCSVPTLLGGSVLKQLRTAEKQ